MTPEDLRFKEIEHKFVVDAGFDLTTFRAVIGALGPTRTSAVHVIDRYYLTDGGRERGYVIRHRFDAELHHLTLKTLEVDPEVRVEINLDLGHHAGDQHAAVEAFVGQLGVRWSGTIRKDLDVWYFPDCEVVHYQAATGSRSVRCIEFEAKGQGSLEEALATVERYEHATGFDPTTRSRVSLLQLLFPELAGTIDAAGV